MAFNVDPRLEHFGHIVPCGIGDRPVGSVAQLLGGGAGLVSNAGRASRNMLCFSAQIPYA